MYIGSFWVYSECILSVFWYDLRGSFKIDLKGSLYLRFFWVCMGPFLSVFWDCILSVFWFDLEGSFKFDLTGSLYLRFFRVYIGLFWVYTGALVNSQRALLSVFWSVWHKSLFGNRAEFSIHRALLSNYRALLNVQGSFECLWGSFGCVEDSCECT